MVDPRTLGDAAARIEVDGRAYEGTTETMTGAQILALAGLDADAHDLYARGSHGRRIGAEEPVVVQDGARFETRPRFDA